MGTIHCRRRVLLGAAPLGLAGLLLGRVRPAYAQGIGRVVVLEGFSRWSEERLANYRAQVASGLPTGAKVQVVSQPFSEDHHLAFVRQLVRDRAVDAVVAEYFQAGEVISHVGGLRGLIVHSHASQPDPRVPLLRSKAASPLCFVGSRLVVEPKLLELARDLLPACRRVGYLVDRRMAYRSSAAAAARSLSMEPLVELRVDDNFSVADLALQVRNARVDAAVVPVSSGLWPRRSDVVAALLRARVPGIFERPVAARDGALVGYGADPRRLDEQSAGFAARILRGENANVFPVLAPDRVLLEVNLTTARKLGLAVPRDLLRRATSIVQ